MFFINDNEHNTFFKPQTIDHIYKNKIFKFSTQLIYYLSFN